MCVYMYIYIYICFINLQPNYYQKSSFLIVSLPFTLIYALQVSYICWIYMVKIVPNGLLLHISSQLHIQ